MKKTIAAMTRITQVLIFILFLPELAAASFILWSLVMVLFSDPSKLEAPYDAIVYILYNARSVGFIVLIEIIYRVWLSRRRDSVDPR